MNVFQDKLKWASTLKPEDLVCDCRYKHLQIKSIEPELMAPRWILRVTKYIPNWLADKFEYFMERHFPVVTDYNVELEDGAHCSAMNCLDPADHEWKHGEEEN